MKNEYRFVPNIQLFADPAGDVTFTQAELDKIVSERVARAQAKFDKEKKELERKHGETLEEYEERVKNANLTAEEKYQKEIEKIKKDLEAKDSELAKIKSDEVKKACLAKYKLSDKFLGRITGNTEEEIEASVKEFSEAIGDFIKSQVGGEPGALNGGSSGGASKKAQVEELKKKAMESGEPEDRAAYVKANKELESGGKE